MSKRDAAWIADLILARQEGPVLEDDESSDELSKWPAMATQNPLVPPVLDPHQVILRYPADGPGALPISIRDLGFLAPRKFLNDAIVQFGLQLAFEELRAKNPQIADSLHIFSSFFYKKLSAERIEDTYPAVAKWTKRVDIFAKEYLIIPIHDMASRHWYLAIICHPSHLLGSNTNGKSYCLTLDSLNADHEPMAALLHTYLKLEAQQKHQEPVDSRLIYVKAKVPQQDNGYDCGVYLLHLAKHFMQDPSGRLSLILSQRGTQRSRDRRMQDWEGEETSSLREKLRLRIDQLSTEWRIAQESLQRVDALSSESDLEMIN